VSRDLDWGIPVPVEGAEGKVLYVWFDAPIGYISATKDLTPDWEKYWKSEDTKLVHFIGKDNIVFHCIVFPSMLKAHGEYILPENVPANEFLNLEGDKISTSRNWAVWLHEYLDEFPGKEDVLRYVLCANAPETKDNDFTWKDYQARNNNELVAVLGNFVNRALVLTQKYYEGAVPSLGELTEYDEQTIAELGGIKSSLESNIENYRFREALKDAMNFARIGNKYLADTEPWKVVKTDPERVKTILNIALQITANVAVAIEPFMPFSSEKILNMLNINKLDWESLGSMSLLEAGHVIGKPVLLFEKIEDDVIEAQLKRLADIKAQNAAEEAAQNVTAQKEECTYDDFQKMDIRVSTILAAEKVAKTKKLLKLTVDTGIDKRTIVSGIAEHFTPEELVGRQVLVLVNLAPRELKGITSNGMILMAEDASGKLELLAPEHKTNNGAIVG
ncbi:MAG: methionine--tRNA ligase subunit beta, partial [Alistipes sp.]|nr:methionine--tRNA ligase subunit beta [Alistipes sp.]